MRKSRNITNSHPPGACRAPQTPSQQKEPAELKSQGILTDTEFQTQKGNPGLVTGTLRHADPRP
jgi:hypothetical protein